MSVVDNMGLTRPTAAGIKVVHNDATASNFTNTTIATLATVSGLDFTAGLVYRVTVIINLSSATNVTTMGVAIGDGTDVNDLVEDDGGSAGANNLVQFVFTVAPLDSATLTQAYGIVEVQESGAPTGEQALVTLANSKSWTDMDRILIRGYVSASDDTDLVRVIVEEISSA